MIGGADHSVDIVGRLARHFHGGGIYKRKSMKMKNYTRFGKLERHVQRLCEKINSILFDGRIIDTCIAIRQVKCWRTYHTTQIPYKVIKLTCVHLAYTNQPPALASEYHGLGEVREKRVR